MAKAPKKSDQEQVSELIEKMDHPWKEIVEFLCRTILDISSDISEQIKWNSPSFYYNGEMQPFDPKEYKRDLVVLNLHRNNHILMVFPTGAKITDTTGVLEGSYTDGRRMIKITSLEEAKTKAAHVETVIKVWLELVEK
jgi:hypothetical protein